MLFPSCSRILLFPCLSSPHCPNKIVLGPSCTWIRCIRGGSWYSNGPFNSNLVETFKTNALNASFNVCILDRFIWPFGTCNGSLLVFLGWSTLSFLSYKGGVDFLLTHLMFWNFLFLNIDQSSINCLPLTYPFFPKKHLDSSTFI
jgi:hypothetical protein